MQNKTSSAVQLKHLPSGLVVKFQGQRSRDYNRKEARRILADKLEAMEKGNESRMALKIQEKARKKASKTKKAKRKYKALAEAKEETKKIEMDVQISRSMEGGG
jgi:protein subunit release factor B